MIKGRLSAICCKINTDNLNIKTLYIGVVVSQSKKSCIFFDTAFSILITNTTIISLIQPWLFVYYL
ncbi:hypothetical protein KAR52_03610, partial [Candidatus Pacearchaeota archaeon]|nr:hypothetical protein [Candidatus Pacearchaeota archaeon]